MTVGDTHMNIKKTKTIGETPDNQEQLDMLEKLAK